MHELPKIALARLKAKAADPENKSALPASGPAAFQGAEHPDANLLAAFVEKSLTDKERAQVLNHLAVCATCREVAALTLLVDQEVTESLRAGGRQGWNPWPVLRWGAMAAVLATAAIVVALNPEMWRRQPSVSNPVRPTPPAQTVMSARPTPPSPSIVQPNSEATAVKKEMETRKSQEEMASMGKAEAAPGNGPQNGRVEPKHQVALMASVQPPAPAKALSTVKAERQDERSGNALSTPAMPAPQPPPAPAATSEATSEVAAMAKAGSETEAAPASVRATDRGVAFGTSVGGVAESPLAKTPPSAGASGIVRVYGQAPVVAMRVASKSMEAGTAPPAALWNISSKDKVQRSTDGGKTYEEILVAPGVKFHAVVAMGKDVWAGGTGGALFHSPDAGATWTRVGIDSGGHIVTKSIVGIQMRDARHLTVTLASGEQWATQDGGGQWQKKP